jgi:2-oxoglutarate ferredoxin oxidoreductase subunit alpha
MYDILRLEMPEKALKLTSLAHLDGMPLTAAWVVENLLQKEQSA